MKSLVVLCAIVFAASAEDFHMKLSENGETFTEDVIVDLKENTEEIKVPQHQDRAELDLLNDFNMGLSAMKLPNSKKCYISKVAPSEQKPAEMEQSMTLAKSKFPTQRYMVETFKVLIVRKMMKTEVGKKIAAHCNGYDMFFTMRFNKENIEEEALKMVKNARVGRIRARRDVPVTTFTTCNNESTKVAETCPPEKLGARCTFFRSDQRVCVYRITCQPTGGQSRGFANCVGNHRFDLMQCCDFRCMS